MKLRHGEVHHSQNCFVCSSGGDGGRCALCDEESYFREVQNWDVVLSVSLCLIYSPRCSSLAKKNNCNLNKICKI